MQTSLFDWKPPCAVIVFPMTKRVGRIRDVATKLLDKPTDKAASFYRNQVTDSLIKSMGRAGIADAEQDEHLGAFWNAVDCEMIRRTYEGHGTGGAA